MSTLLVKNMVSDNAKLAIGTVACMAVCASIGAYGAKKNKGAVAVLGFTGAAIPPVIGFFVLFGGALSGSGSNF